MTSGGWMFVRDNGMNASFFRPTQAISPSHASCRLERLKRFPVIASISDYPRHAWCTLYHEVGSRCPFAHISVRRFRLGRWPVCSERLEGTARGRQPVPAEATLAGPEGL